jgi:hypothetical protein
MNWLRSVWNKAAAIAAAVWAGLTRTSTTSAGGFVNEGEDWRWDPFGLFSRIQRAASFHSDVEPFSILICVVPPMVAVNIPLLRGKYLVLRVGFRYDGNWKGYIFPEGVIKVLDHTIFY